jgi:hypothetical protein
MRREQINELAEEAEAARCRIIEKRNMTKEEVPTVLMGDLKCRAKNTTRVFWIWSYQELT